MFRYNLQIYYFSNHIICTFKIYYFICLGSACKHIFICFTFSLNKNLLYCGYIFLIVSCNLTLCKFL